MKRILSRSLLAVLLAPAAGCAAGDPVDTAESVGESAAAVTASAVLQRSSDLDGEDNHRDEICEVDLDWLNSQPGFAVAAGDQIRIRVSGGSAGQKGACTVQNRLNSTLPGNVVRMGNFGYERVDVAISGEDGPELAIELDNVVTSDCGDYSSESQLRAAEEFCDAVQETSSTQTDVVVLAPHGGQMELRTDRQANTHFYDQLPAGQVTSWKANGYNDSDDDDDGQNDDIGASDHWHITATQLRPTGFHHLSGVTDRRFKYPVAFHGYTSTRDKKPFHRWEVLVGGRESALFRREIAEMITLGARNPSTLATTITGVWQNLPDDLDGSSEANLVNWIGTTGKGLQLEQSSEARNLGESTADDLSDEIARAVGVVYRCLVDSPHRAFTAPATATTQWYRAIPAGICDRLIVDVDIPSTATGTFQLDTFFEMNALEQTECSQFEGYVSIYKEIDGRWERQHGGQVDASWNSFEECVVTQTPGPLTVNPPASGTDKYRITVKGEYGATLPMNRLKVRGGVRRLP